jgi:hypothetical protein
LGGGSLPEPLRDALFCTGAIPGSISSANPGDIARQARKDKEKSADKPKTIITDDTLPSSKSLSGWGDLGRSQSAGDSAAMSKALSRLEQAESELNKLDTLDRATLAKAVLMDQDVAFPNRRNWVDRLYSEKQHYVSHERELIVEVKKTAGQVESWKASQGGQKLDHNDPRLQQLRSRVAEIIPRCPPHGTRLPRRGDGRVGSRQQAKH